jgi:hypothetical protein
MRISHEDICSMQFVIEINILQTIVYLGKILNLVAQTVIAKFRNFH